jgi:hypothetical protein
LDMNGPNVYWQGKCADVESRPAMVWTLCSLSYRVEGGPYLPKRLLCEALDVVWIGASSHQNSAGSVVELRIDLQYVQESQSI